MVVIHVSIESVRHNRDVTTLVELLVEVDKHFAKILTEAKKGLVRALDDHTDAGLANYCNMGEYVEIFNRIIKEAGHHG